MNNAPVAKTLSKTKEAPIVPKLFSKPGVLALYIGIIGIFLSLQLAGIYLFAPIVFNDFSLTAAQRFGSGSFDGTVTSYSMIFTLVGLTIVIYGLIKWRISKISQSSVTVADDANSHHVTKSNYNVTDYLALKPFALNVAMGVVGLWLLFAIGTETLTYVLDKDPTAFVDELYASAKPKWLLILTMVVVAPIYEELMFRGILWSAVREQFLGKKGIWLATLVTSLLFSIIHLQYEFYEMSVIFILALLLSYARVKSGSLYLPILLHIINNGIAMWMYLLIS